MSMRAIILLALSGLAAADYSGKAYTYGQGGAGTGGSCTSDFVPPGFITVAMNPNQYNCGNCLNVCVTNPETGYACYNAIVDNKCYECGDGGMDLGINGSNVGVANWHWITCPSSGIYYKAAPGNSGFYGKFKVQGGPSSAVSCNCNGNQWTRTDDGYFTYQDNSGVLGCGPQCTFTFYDGSTRSAKLDGGLFGGYCNGAPQGPAPGPSPTMPHPAPTNPPGSAPTQSNPAPTGSPRSCPKTYSQCGGKTYTGKRKCCNSSDTCTVVNEWYSQCQPGGTPGTCAKTWSQCGGMNYTGTSKCCSSSDTCSVVNEWYSQCKPK